MRPSEIYTATFDPAPEKTPARHRARHELLHRHYDELIADYLIHNPDRMMHDTNLMDLAAWSNRQTRDPQTRAGAASDDGHKEGLFMPPHLLTDEALAAINRAIAQAKTPMGAYCIGIVSALAWQDGKPPSDTILDAAAECVDIHGAVDWYRLTTLVRRGEARPA